MNARFAEYTTTTAFLLALTKCQCNCLLRVADSNRVLESHTVSTGRQLEAKGLVWWEHDADGNPIGFRGLTKAGQMVVGLLREAGMTIESTNTISVLKRVA